MSNLLGKELPDNLYELLKGEDVASQMGKVILITTVDAQGFPHPAMLSFGEMAARDVGNIRLATYKGSTTSTNLVRNKKLTVIIADEGITYYIKGTVTPLGEALKGLPYMVPFNMKVEQVLEDAEPEAPITTGIRFKPPEGTALLDQAEKILPEILAL